MKEASKQDWLDIINKRRILFKGLYKDDVQTKPIKEKRKRKARDVFDKHGPKKTKSKPKAVAEKTT